MSAPYLPLQLIHAQLPPPPSPPNAIPELRVPTDRPFPSSSSHYDEPLHSEHATSAVHEPITNILARTLHNGYVLELRTLATTTSVDVNRRQSAGSPVVRIYFPDRLLSLVPGCIVVGRRDGKLVILVLTEEYHVYRLTFPLDSLEEGKDERILFRTDGDDWCEEYTVDGEVIAAAGGVGAWNVLDGNTLVLGGVDGGIILLSRTQSYRSAEWTAAHHRPSAKFRLFGRGSSEDQVVALAPFQHAKASSLIYALSRDRRLRIWNVQTGVCLKTLDLRSSESSHDLVVRGESSPNSSKSVSALPNASDTPYLKVLPHPYTTSRYSHLVIVFSPAAGGNSISAGTFIVFRATGSNTGSADLIVAGERPCSSFSAGCALRDFEIVAPFVKAVDGISLNTGWRLAVTWDKNSSLAVETVCMDDIFQFDTYIPPSHPSPLLLDWQVAADDHNTDAFDPAYFDDLLPIDLPEDSDPFNHDDIASTFISHLFRPGRFSTLTLQTALDEYLRQLPDVVRMRHVADSRLSLSRRYDSIIGRHLTMEVDPQSGAPVVSAFRRDLKLHWLGIWARVRALDKQARWPLSMAMIEGQTVALSREAFSVASIQDVAAVLTRFASDPSEAHLLRATPEGALRALYPPLAPPKARSSVLAIASAGAFLASFLSSQNATESNGSSLEEFTTSLNTIVANPPTQPVENLAGELWDDCVDPCVSEEDRTTIRRILSECVDIQRGLIAALDVLNSFDFTFAGETSSMRLSGAGNALLASAITALANARYMLARNVVLVALLCLAESPDPSSGDPDSEELITILARAFYVYQRLRVLQWLGEQTGEEARERAPTRRIGLKRKAGEGDAALTEGLGGLKMREMQEETDADGWSGTYSLLDSLLDRRYPMAGVTGTPDPLLERSLHFVRSLGVVRAGAWEMQATSADALRGMAILLDGHPTLAGHFAALYPHGASLAYIKGRAYAALGLANDAVRSLEQGAAGCKDGSLTTLVPTVAGSNAVSEYYRHVAFVFGDPGQDAPVVHFGQLAIRTAPSSHPAGKDVWTKVFLANVAMGLYEDAYSVLTTTPYPDLKDEFLGQLISVMCENNEIARLNQLGFIGFQDRVEILLSFKARNSDPLRFPNYYKVLYSWHIARGDYRSAGDIMYRQARRFANGASSKISPHELAAMQARSYLAAINALALVDKRNAWVAIPSASTPRSLRGVKRRKANVDIPEEAYAKDKQAIDIISLDDIRMEYTLVLSQLQLATAAPDLQLQGATMSPEEVIGILTQRGLFDLAFACAEFLHRDMTDLFRALATRCVELHRALDLPSDGSLANWLHKSPITSRLRGPPADLASRYLQVSLSRHDGSNTQYRYRGVVADTMFAMNQEADGGWQMPPWLVEWEMARDPEGWISRALRWGWVSQAVDWALDILRNATPPELLPPRKPDVACMPYTLFDRVIAAAGDGDEKADSSVQSKVKILREATNRRIASLEGLI